MVTDIMEGESPPPYPVQMQPITDMQPTTTEPTIPTNHLQNEVNSPGHHNYPAYVAFQPTGHTSGFQQAGIPINNGQVATSTSAYIYWGRTPQPGLCQSCNKVVITEVEYKTGPATWLFCFTSAMAIGWCLPFICFIPFCMENAKDTIHSCPDCKTVIIRRKR